MCAVLNRPITWGILYGLRAFLFIHFLGERLTPDTRLYSEGRAAWSSPVCAMAGYLAGYVGVVVVGVVGAAWLGWLVARNSRNMVATFLLGISPPGWYTIQPSADAAGSASAVWACSRPWRYRYLVLVAAFHLEAALVLLGCRIVGRFTSLRLDFAAIGMGVVACLGQWHIQVRYLLPGAALLASGRKRFSLRSSEVCTIQLIPCSKTSVSPYLRPRWYWEHY